MNSSFNRSSQFLISLPGQLRSYRQPILVILIVIDEPTLVTAVFRHISIILIITAVQSTIRPKFDMFLGGRSLFILASGNPEIVEQFSPGLPAGDHKSGSGVGKISMEIKLIAIDVDGTLLDDHHHLPEQNLKVIQAATKVGVRVILATGRMRNSCAWLIDTLGLQSPGIFVQGLSITDAQGQVIYQEWLDKQVLHHFLPFADDQQLSFVAFSDQTTITHRRDAYTDIIRSYNEPEPIEVLDITRHKIHKIIIFSEPEKIQQIRPLLDGHMNGRADVLITQPEMVEIMPAGTSKGKSLRWLANELRIPLGQTMAIGNSENDIEMLRVAGVSIAVENAIPSVKMVSDHIVSSNNEAGVAEAIERFVL